MAPSVTEPPSATVNVANVAPSATFHAPAIASATGTFTLSFTDASDPSPTDTAAGFEYAFDCGSGYGAFGTASTKTCAGQPGPINVGGKIRDKDGAVRTYTAVVNGSIRFAKQHVLDEVNDLIAAATQKNVQEKLRDAAKSLAKSLDRALWLDEIRLDPKDGGHVFDDEQEAAKIGRASCRERVYDDV